MHVKAYPYIFFTALCIGLWAVPSYVSADVGISAQEARKIINKHPQLSPQKKKEMNAVMDKVLIDGLVIEMLKERGGASQSEVRQPRKKRKYKSIGKYWE